MNDSKRKNYIICNAINKYGEENFKIEEIDCANTLKDLNKKEKYWIKKLRTQSPYGYNLHSGGKSYEVTDETRKKISDSRKGIVPWNKGIPCREDTKRKLSKLNKGNKNWKFRKPLSEESRKNISLANTGNKYWLGKKHSDETKQRLSKIKSKPVVCITTGEVYKSAKHAAEELNIYSTNITQVCKGNYKNTRGYKFKYYNK